jgi:hypothetical protein
MGRVMPRDFVKAVGEDLDQAAPAHKKEMIDAIHKACSGTKGIFGVGWDRLRAAEV